METNSQIRKYQKKFYNSILQILFPLMYSTIMFFSATSSLIKFTSLEEVNFVSGIFLFLILIYILSIVYLYFRSKNVMTESKYPFSETDQLGMYQRVKKDFYTASVVAGILFVVLGIIFTIYYSSFWNLYLGLVPGSVIALYGLTKTIHFGSKIMEMNELKETEIGW